MRLYYDASEIVSMGETGEFIRADITDMTDSEKADTLLAIKDVMSGKEYSLTEHHCYHDGGGKPCEMKEI